MTKRKKTVAVLSVAICVLTIGASVMVSNGFISEQDPVSGELLEVTGVSGVKFASTTTTTNADGSITKTIQYVIEPAAAYLNDFIIDFGWAETEEADKDWESDDWADDKKFDDYLTYEIDQPNCELAITCKQAFGTTAVLTMSDATDPSIKAEMNIDYRRKLTTHSEASVSSPSFTNNTAIQVTASDEEYSIGSVGDRARESITPSLSMSYSGGTSSYSTFESLFSGVTTNISKSLYKYQGENYSSADSVNSAIISNTKAYLESIPTTDGSVKFDATTFHELLVYQAYSYTTYHDVYTTQTNVYTNFVQRYNAAYETGGGYTLKADLGYTDVTAQTWTIALDVSETATTSITFPDGDIEF